MGAPTALLAAYGDNSTSITQAPAAPVFSDGGAPPSYPFTPGGGASLGASSAPSAPLAYQAPVPQAVAPQPYASADPFVEQMRQLSAMGFSDPTKSREALV